MKTDSEFVGLIAESSAKFFEPLAGPETWRAAERGEGFAALWERIEDSGFLDVLTPGDANTATRGAAAAAILHNAGRALVPAPIGETMAGRAFLAESGVEWPLGPLALGSHRAAYGRYVRAYLVLEKGALSAAPKPRVIGEGVNVAGEPRDDLHAEQISRHNTAWPDARLAAAGAAVRASQMAGATERILMLTVDYARTRKQFGKPIGQFQAIQHALAILAGHAAAAQTAAAHAWRNWAHQDFVMLAAAAKIRCGEAAGAAISIAHQTHGAIGITQEHELHFATRRLHAWRTEFGSESHWSGVLGAWAAAKGPDDLWATITRS
jgi:acyl-CoA dehydrogenase